MEILFIHIIINLVLSFVAQKLNMEKPGTLNQRGISDFIDGKYLLIPGGTIIVSSTNPYGLVCVLISIE